MQTDIAREAHTVNPFQLRKGMNNKLFFTDIDECNSNPCQNGATCRDHVNSYSCTCVAGFNGTNCETSKWKF